jgi:hypothetical protein
MIPNVAMSPMRALIIAGTRKGQNLENDEMASHNHMPNSSEFIFMSGTKQGSANNANQIQKLL